MYVCDLCNRSLSIQGSLKRHRESVHRQSAGFSCEICSQRFYRKDHLGRHMNVHQPAVEVRRDLLSCSADATVDLPPPSPPPKKHRETPVCDLCAKTFASQKTLKRHRQTVRRQSGGFSCRVCDRHFYRRKHLKKHHSSKHADKEFEASLTLTLTLGPICQKSFHYRGHLREHLKTHPVTLSPATTFHAERRACPVDMAVRVPEECRKCFIENWSQIRSRQQVGRLFQVHS